MIHKYTENAIYTNFELLYNIINGKFYNIIQEIKYFPEQEYVKNNNKFKKLFIKIYFCRKEFLDLIVKFKTVF